MEGKAVGELESTQIKPDVALVRELRTLFEALGVSQNRYAARVHLDKSVVSRYLTGDRIPHWDFVHRLLVEATMRNDGMAPTPEVVKHLRTLHLAALEAGGSPWHQIQLLQEQLAEADAQAQRADRRERELEQALEAVQYQVAELEVRCRELEDIADRKLDEHSAELALLRNEADAERSALLAEIERLTRELELVQRRRVAAEARCEELERQLEGVADQRDHTEPAVREQPERVPDVAARIDSERLARMLPMEVVDLLREMSESDAKETLALMSDKRLGAAMFEMTSARAALVLALIDPARAARILAELPVGDAALILGWAQASVIAAVADELAGGDPSGILLRIAAGRLADVADLLAPADAGRFLGYLDAMQRADVMELLDFGRLEVIVAAMPPSEALQLLSVHPRRGLLDRLFGPQSK
jgi:hypothetical protein